MRALSHVGVFCGASNPLTVFSVRCTLLKLAAELFRGRGFGRSGLNNLDELFVSGLSPSAATALSARPAITASAMPAA